MDVIIAGLGAMGSAAAYHLARSGVRVLGFDRFHPPHTWGSSHGQSRIIRETYYEHPVYVPLVQRAYALWADFVIDFHPAHPQILIASPCSGHGFKFSAAIGEIVSQLLMTGATPFDLSLFHLDPERFI